MFNISNRTIVYEEDNKKNTSNLSAGDIVLMVVEKGTNARVIERVIDNKHKLEDIIAGKEVKEDDEDKEVEFDLLSLNTEEITVSGFVYDGEDADKTFFITAGNNCTDGNKPENAINGELTFNFIPGISTGVYEIELYRADDPDNPIKKWGNKFLTTKPKPEEEN